MLLDVTPSEVVPRAGVLHVSDAGELVSLGLPLEVIGLLVSVDRDRHVDLLAIPGLIAGFGIRNVDAETVLEVPAHCALNVSYSVAVILIGVLTWNLSNVGPHVDLDCIVVAAAVVVDEAGVKGVLLVGTIVVASDGGVVDGKGGGSE